MSSVKKVTLKSSDGEIFEVEETVAMESQTIKSLIEDDCANNAIPLPNVTSHILSLVIQYCKEHTSSSDSKSSKSNEELKAWDTQFINVDLNVLFDLIMVCIQNQTVSFILSFQERPFSPFTLLSLFMLPCLIDCFSFWLSWNIYIYILKIFLGGFVWMLRKQESDDWRGKTWEFEEKLFSLISICLVCGVTLFYWLCVCVSYLGVAMQFLLLFFKKIFFFWGGFVWMLRKQEGDDWRGKTWEFEEKLFSLISMCVVCGVMHRTWKFWKNKSLYNELRRKKNFAIC